MKVILICGSHPRHCYIANQLFKAQQLAGIVIERREEFIPSPPSELNGVDKEIFIKHFRKREEAENKFFGNVDFKEIVKTVPFLETTYEELNSKETIDFMKGLKCDFLFSYGCGLLTDQILNEYENKCFNIHGGLSPWFKGSATLFWSFYFLKPNWAGMTIHRLSNKIDAGDILHHSVPLLERGDGIHDIACKAVLKVGEDVVKILNLIENGKEVFCVKQWSDGKLFVTKDWMPQHLRLVYNTFNDNIVDCFLDGDIVSNGPKLVDFIVS